MDCHPTSPHKLYRSKFKAMELEPAIIRIVCALGKLIFITFLIELALLQFDNLSTCWFSFESFANFELIWLDHSHLLYKSMKSDMHQGLGQAICNYLLDENVGEFNLFGSYFIIDVIMLNVNMFCLEVEDQIICKRYRALVITF